MHENKYNQYRIPSGLLVVFLEKALTLIHMEVHLDDVSFCFGVSISNNRMRNLKCVSNPSRYYRLIIVK